VKTTESNSAEKKIWVSPEVSRMRAGDAETQAGPQGDGGGGAQGS
jgi:hypothetical protein